MIGGQRPGEAEEFLRRAVLLLDKLATDFPTGLGYRNVLADALIEHARLLKQLGRTPDAEKTYGRAIAVYEKLATDFPTMPAYWQFAFDQRIKLGQFLKEAGKIKEASGVYGDADAIVSKLPTDVPGRLAHWVGLARAHCELGRMLSSAGKKQEAEAEFRRLVTLSEKLEADSAGKPEHRRDLAHSHTIAAWELAEARLHADADRLYGWALQHYLALVREAPQSQQSQEELAFLHFTLGGHHLWRTRRLKDADRSFQVALEIFDKLALQFPAIPAYRAREAECHILLGIVAHYEGRTLQAEQYFRQGIQLAEEVEKELPSDGMLRLYLGQGYHRLAMVLRDAGTPQEVEKSLVQSLAVLDKLVADVPNNDWYLSTLSNTCRSLAEHHIRNGRTEEGQRLNQRAVELSEPILAKEIAPYRKAIELQPENPVGYKNLADVLSRQGKLDEAIAAYRKVIEIASDHKHGDDINLSDAYKCLGEALAVQGQPDEAIVCYRKAIELNPQWDWPHCNLGDALAAKGKLDNAIVSYRKAIELDPEWSWPRLRLAIVLNRQAWALATDSDPEKRDPDRAVELAKEAVELSPAAGLIWNTLGAAHYRAGNSKEAIVALEKSMELRMGGDSNDWFFLAMAHWQLGEKDKARGWFDRAVKWMDEHQPKNVELLRFRAEAAELLGVEEKKD